MSSRRGALPSGVGRRPIESLTSIGRAQRRWGPGGRPVIGATALVTATAAAVLVGGPTAAAPASAAITPTTKTSTATQGTPDPTPVVHGVRLNRSRVAVSGLNTMPVRVTVTASVLPPARGGNDQPWLTATLTRSPKATWPALTGTSVQLTRVGTAQMPGTWTGVLHVPSTLHGTLQVTQLSRVPAETDDGSMVPPIPVTNGPTLRVTGVHQPRIAATPVPRKPATTIGSYRIFGQVLDSATRRPYRSRINVDLVIDGECWRGIPCATRTDSRGRFTFVIRNRPIGTPPTRPVTWGHNLLLHAAAKDALGRPTLVLIAPVRLR